MMSRRSMIRAVGFILVPPNDSIVPSMVSRQFEYNSYRRAERLVIHSDFLCSLLSVTASKLVATSFP